jgi:type IV pilus assembly protein PilE
MKKVKGFTLIELLVVVLIIGILAAIVLPQYQAAVDKSRATEALMVGKTLTSALKRWELINGPISDGNLPNFKDLDIEIPNATYYSPTNLKVQYWDYDVRGNGYTCIRSRAGNIPQSVNYEICISHKTTNKSLCLADINSARADKICKMLGGKIRGIEGTWTYYDDIDAN